MFQITYSVNAERQLFHIIEYVKQEFGTVRAQELFNEIKTSVSLLAQTPYIGRPFKDSILALANHRVLVLKHNLVIYRVDDATQIIYIVAIVDSRQDYISMI